MIGINRDDSYDSAASEVRRIELDALAEVLTGWAIVHRGLRGEGARKWGARNARSLRQLIKRREKLNESA